jgi:phytoene synthase
MGETSDAAEVEIRRTAREFDLDRYLAALLAPASARAGLLTIAAFHGEIARIPAIVHEPTIAAIRLQWWRDVIDDASPAEASSPLANCVRRVLARLPAQQRDAGAMIDAYEDLLRPGALSAPGAVAAFCDAGQGSAFRMIARLLDPSVAVDTPVMRAAAQCYGRTQLLRVLPALLHIGHDPLAGVSTEDSSLPDVAPLLLEARASYAEVRRLAPRASATIRQAILPVALVGPYLKALEGLGPKLAVEQATISPLGRVWRIYAAHRIGRF